MFEADKVDGGRVIVTTGKAKSTTSRDQVFWDIDGVVFLATMIKPEKWRAW